jgi:hypothetical protein
MPKYAAYQPATRYFTSFEERWATWSTATISST